MDDNLLYADLSLDYSKQNVVINKLLGKLESITLMETIDDILFRRIFIAFMQKVHSDRNEIESLKILSRYIICHRILLDQEIFEDSEVYSKLVELCPNLAWQQKIKSLIQQDSRDINFTYVIEKLKWESIMELICHDDYKYYLTAIRQKSRRIKRIVKSSCDVYYF